MIRPGPGRQHGFTLGEVLTTLGVVGVSLSLVVPSPVQRHPEQFAGQRHQ